MLKPTAFLSLAALMLTSVGMPAADRTIAVAASNQGPTLCRQPMESRDRDRNGRLDKWEIEQSLSGEFDGIDINGDGRITLMEYLNCAYQNHPKA